MDNTESLQKDKRKMMEKKSFGIIAALMFGYSLIYMDKSMISLAIIPIGAQFSLDTTQTGAIMSSFFLGYSLLQIPSGWLADKFGAKLILLISLTVGVIFSLVFGLVSGLLSFCVVRCIVGLGHAGYPSSCSTAIAENFPQERRTYVQSLVLSTSGIGGILAFVFGSRLINHDWRVAYYVLAGLFVLAFIGILVFVPNRATQTKKTDVAKTKVSLREIMRNPTVVTLFVAMLLLNFLLYGVMSWIPSFLKTKFTLEITTVSTILAVNAVVQTIATLSVGRLLSGPFLGKERQFLIGTTFLSALAIFGLAFTDTLPVAIVCLFVASMLSVAAFTCIFTWPHKILDQEIIGASIGAINTGGTLGGFFAPLLLGAMIKSTGGDFTIAFVFMAVTGMAAGMVSLLIKRKKS